MLILHPVLKYCNDRIQHLLCFQDLSSKENLEILYPLMLPLPGLYLYFFFQDLQMPEFREKLPRLRGGIRLSAVHHFLQQRQTFDDVPKESAIILPLLSLCVRILLRIWDNRCSCRCWQLWCACEVRTGCWFCRKHLSYKHRNISNKPCTNECPTWCGRCLNSFSFSYLLMFKKIQPSMHKLPDADSVRRMVGDFMCGKVFHYQLFLPQK